MSEDYYKSGDHSRDGYKSQSEGGANGNRFGGGRPRFSRGSFPAGGSNYGQQRGEGGYRARYNNNGYYASDENRQYGNRGDNGGYPNRQRQGGGYRPRYNSNDEGGFQPRTGGYRGGKSRYGQGEMVAISKLMAIVRALHKAEISAAMDQRAVIVPVSKVMAHSMVAEMDVSSSVVVITTLTQSIRTKSVWSTRRKTTIRQCLCV